MGSKAARRRDTETITIRMDRALRERIRGLAERERRSQNAQIELLIEAGLEAVGRAG